MIQIQTKACCLGELARTVAAAAIAVGVVASSTLAADVRPTTSNVQLDHVSHSDALLHFDVQNGPWQWLRVRWTIAPQSCAVGKGGNVMATYYNGGVGPVQRSPKMMLILSGLTPGSKINVCPEISADNQHWSSGTSGEVTTLPLPSPHPALPDLPHVEMPTYPDTKGFAVWRVGETRQPDCSTLYSCYKEAIAEQTKHGTVVEIKAGSTITGRTWVDNSAPDVHDFPATAVRLADSTITIPNHGYKEGQSLIFAATYSNLPGSPQTPGACDGISVGVLYFVHKPTADNFQLTCEKPFAQDGPVMHLRDNGGGKSLKVAAYPRKLFPIVIRTSTPDDQLPPPGTRMNPAWRAKLATLQPDVPGPMAPYTGNGFNNTNLPTTVFNFGNPDGNVNPMTAKTWLVGLEIVTGDMTGTKDEDPLPWGNLVVIPHSSMDNFVDRSYIHGRGYPNRIAIAVFWDGRNNGFLNNYFDGLDYWHAVHGCQSVPSRHVSEGTNAMIGGLGPGPYLFINNYVEGAGNLWHHDGGGGGNHPQNDYFYVRNTFNVPAKYQFGAPGSDGRSYYNRQPLEWKGGRRILLDGNIFPHNFHHIATSTVVFTSVGVGDQLGYGIGDVTITNNTWQHVPAVMTLLSTQGGAFQTAPINRVLVKNNLMQDINGSLIAPLDGTNGCDSSCHCRAWTGWIFQGFNDGEDRIVDHNSITGLSGVAPVLIRMGPSNTEGVQITNNVIDIAATNDQGISPEGGMGDAGGQDRCAGVENGERLLACRSPGLELRSNLLVSSGASHGDIRASWPEKTDTIAANPRNIGAASEVPGVGVDQRKLEDAQGKVRLLGTPEVTGSSAQIRFRAPDSQACPVDVSDIDPKVITEFQRVADPGKDRDRAVTIGGLKSGKEYHFRVNCAVEQPMGSFRTK